MLNEHLHLLTLYQFPEHYGEILKELTNHLNPVSAESWLTFINALAPGGLMLTPDADGLSLKGVVAFVSRFAAEQTLLPCSVLQDTISLLGEDGLELSLYNNTLTSFFFKGMMEDPLHCDQLHLMYLPRSLKYFDRQHRETPISF